jgi:fatty-acyl-CoA synthase
MHPDHYIQIMDRKKDIIISGGENISTVEVENVIYRHPDVLEVAVIPIPDPKSGARSPRPSSCPKPGTKPHGRRYHRLLQGEPGPFQSPQGGRIRRVPKTATGKIQKFKLREKEWAGENEEKPS